MTDDIISLSSKFSTMVEWRDYCASLETTLMRANTKIKELEEQVNNGPIIQEKSTAEIICELEIEKLKTTATMRSLTLEETKRLDLLVKNLLLAKEANKSNKKENSGPSITISEAALIAIASIPEAEDGTN